MTFKFNVTGDERKKLVEAVSDCIGWAPIYKKAPTFAYLVNNVTIDKHGTLTGEVTPELLEALAEKGYTYETDGAPEPETTEAQEVPTEPEAEPTDEQILDRLAIQVDNDLSDTAFQNLENLIASKGELMKRALGVDSLPIERNENVIGFPWFSPDAAPEEINAYSQFITALCRMAKELKRVSAKECDTDNDKFSFRVFLIRLDMKGDEYAAARKILLSKLTGNGSFRYGEPAERRAKTKKPGKKGKYDCLTEFVARLTATVDSIVTEGLTAAPQDGVRWELPYVTAGRYGVEHGDLPFITKMLAERPEIADIEETANELYLTFKPEYRPDAEDGAA